MAGRYLTVARIRSFYLYEFLLGVTVITIVLQMLTIVGITPFSENDEKRNFPTWRDLPDIGSSADKSRNGIAKDDNIEVRDNIGNGSQSDISLQTPCRNTSSSSLSVLVFGGINVIRQWKELSALVKEFKLIEKNKYSFNVTCAHPRVPLDLVLDKRSKDLACESTLVVTLSSNMAELEGQNIVVLGMSPYSLKIKTKVMRNKVSPKQLFVFYGVETPLRMVEWIPDAGRQPLHGVWSYGGSSETVLPYGRYTEYAESVDVDIEQIIGKKSKLIAWMGSNCVKQVFWPRMAFIHELQKYLKVDTYGKCGNLTCLPRMSEHCQKLMGEYKFYLALENAECSDYMTEKFWDTGLIQGAVPVVYGAKKEDYERVAPPGSFIHVSDFESVESLAKYLRLLDRNDGLYQKFFDWRKKGKVEIVFPPLKPMSFCDLIKQHRLLREGLLKEKTLADTSWYNGCRHKVAKSYPSDDFLSWRPWK